MQTNQHKRKEKITKRLDVQLQNSHDRETCARSLRATQESRPPPGAFPPPPPQPEPLLPVDCPLSLAMSQDTPPADQLQPQQQQQVRRRSTTTTTAAHHRATRPVSLDIGTSQRRAVLQQPLAEQQQVGTVAVATHPSSAPAVYAGRSFFEELGNASVQGNPSFELNVNVACNPVSSHGGYGTRKIVLYIMVVSLWWFI